ncbi:chromosomal replication initiator protein DnaA [Candidatus Saccharibacteria bacterium]|nr:chromosomal replication initiator protein DnaA [Candidatus Saccharibacteria bacterium]
MNHALWQSVLGEIELTVSHATFTTWFKNTELIDSNDGQVVISVPNIFAKKQFEVKFNDQIKCVLEKNGVKPRSIIYTINTSSRTSRPNRDSDQITTSPLIKEDTSTNSSSYKPAQSNPGGLNPRYTFDNFIVGSSNDLAYTASRAVASSPGVKYNPVYFYGGVGLGKTHLMQAIGNEILQKDPKARVLYLSSQTFVNEFMDHIRFKKKDTFSDKYRNVDVLIIDDMQFIAGKEKTQEEFFHTFNHLHQNNKQIIISSDKPPKSIPTLTERLRSRFEMGMTIDIQMPDFETRCAIVSIKASQSGITLKQDTVEYLATNIKTNIRELEGALNRLLAYAEMRGIEPDISTAEGLLGNIRHSRPQHITSKQIIDRTAKHFQLDVNEICSEKRDKHIVVPRQIAMYLLRSELHLSFPKIASELGRKDHTTAIHSIEKIEKAIKLDYLIREQVSSIREKLYA